MDLGDFLLIKEYDYFLQNKKIENDDNLIKKMDISLGFISIIAI